MMAANGGTDSATEPPGLETQRREIENLNRNQQLRAGDSWWEKLHLQIINKQTNNSKQLVNSKQTLVGENN